MELGVACQRPRLHSKRYFETLVGELDPDDDAALALAVCRSLVELDQPLMRRIEQRLAAHPLPAQRARASRRACLNGLRDGEPIVRLGRPRTP